MLCEGREYVPGIDSLNAEETPFPCPLCPLVVKVEGEAPERLSAEERFRSWQALRVVLYGECKAPCCRCKSVVAKMMNYRGEAFCGGCWNGSEDIAREL